MGWENCTEIRLRKKKNCMHKRSIFIIHKVPPTKSNTPPSQNPSSNPLISPATLPHSLLLQVRQQQPARQFTALLSILASLQGHQPRSADASQIVTPPKRASSTWTSIAHPTLEMDQGVRKAVKLRSGLKSFQPIGKVRRLITKPVSVSGRKGRLLYLIPTVDGLMLRILRPEATDLQTPINSLATQTSREINPLHWVARHAHELLLLLRQKVPTGLSHENPHLHLSSAAPDFWEMPGRPMLTQTVVWCLRTLESPRNLGEKAATLRLLQASHRPSSQVCKCGTRT